MDAIMCHRKKYYYGVAACLLVAALIFLKYSYAYFLRPQESGLPGLLHQKEVDILFLGSSCTGQAIDIRRIEQRYHISAYNLSYNSLNPAVAAEMLNFIVNDTDVKLHTVVVEAYPFKQLVPFLLEDTRIFTDAPALLKNKILRRLLKEEVALPFSSLYELIVTADNESLITFPINKKIVDSFFYKGAYINKTVPGMTSFRKIEHVPHPSPTYYQMQRDALLRMIEICAQKNIDLIFVEPFLPQITQQGKTYKNARHVIEETLSSKNAKFIASAEIVLPNDDASYFTDNIHLSSKGRELYTDAMLKLLPVQ